MCWGCLRFLFRPFFATVRCSAIYRGIPTWVTRCRCYVSVTVGGATLRMGRLVYNLLDYANLGDSLARGDADRVV